MGTQMCFLAQKICILSVISPQNERQRIYVELASELNSMLKMNVRFFTYYGYTLKKNLITTPERHIYGSEEIIQYTIEFNGKI